jgi:signal peptidase I
MINLPRIAKVSCAIAFLMAGFEFFVAFWTGTVIVTFLALISLVAGIGILRGRIWSAYGFAFFSGAQLLLAPIALLRSNGSPMSPLQILTSAVVEAALAVLFFRTGRSLQAAGGRRGHSLPWIAISILVVVPLVFLEPFVLPSDSMANTLLAGDRFFVQVWPKPNPVRGEILAFHYPLNRHEVYVKRVIGIPGDRIRISNKNVYRNGAPLQEPYAIHESSYADTYGDNFPGTPNIQLPPAAQSMLQQNVVNGEVVVPQGNYFVLGDNRDDSSDSRYWGFVPASDFVGRPLVIYDSHEQTTSEALSPASAAKAKVRWNRLFKIL